MISLKNTLEAIKSAVSSHESSISSHESSISSLKRHDDFAVITRWSSPKGDSTKHTTLGWSLTTMNPYMTIIYSSRSYSGSWYADGTGVYVPHSGYVVVKASIYTDSVNGGSQDRIGVYTFKNGVEIGGQFTGFCVGPYLHVTYPIQVNAGDYITTKARMSTPGTGYACLGDKSSWISIEYV